MNYVGDLGMQAAFLIAEAHRMGLISDEVYKNGLIEALKTFGIDLSEQEKKDE